MQTPSILPSTELFNSVLWFFLLAVFLGHPKEVTLSCSSHGIIRSAQLSSIWYSLRGLHPSNRPRSPSTLSSGHPVRGLGVIPPRRLFTASARRDVRRASSHGSPSLALLPSQSNLRASQLIPSILPYPTTTQGPSTTKKSASRVQESIFSSHGGRAGPCRLW